MIDGSVVSRFRLAFVARAMRRRSRPTRPPVEGDVWTSEAARAATPHFSFNVSTPPKRHRGRGSSGDHQLIHRVMGEGQRKATAGMSRICLNTTSWPMRDCGVTDATRKRTRTVIADPNGVHVIM
jgi:hypothetical protein